MADTATQLPETRRRARWPYLLAAAAVLAAISAKWLIPIGMEQRAIAAIRADCPDVRITIPSAPPPKLPTGAAAIRALLGSSPIGSWRSTNIKADYVGPDILREWTGHEFLQIESIKGSAYALRPAIDQLRWLGNVVDVELHDLEDEDAASIGHLTEVEFSNLRWSHITDAGLSHFGDLVKLRQLIVPSAEINGSGFAAWSALDQLEELDLTHTLLTDEGLQYVSEFGGLKSLHLAGTRITDDGLIYLRKLPKLETLIILGTPVSNDGLIHLKNLKHLKTLSLLETCVTDAGLEHLLPLTTLEDLDLSNTQVTLKGVRQLRGCRNLRRLRLGGFELSNAQRAELQRALPGCEVTRY